MKKTILSLIALALLAGPAAAFDLEAYGASDVPAAPALRAPASPQAPSADELIGLDVNVRVPFKLVNGAVAKMAAAEPRLSLLNPGAPVVFKYGEFLRVSNIRIDQGGIIVVPTLTLKPYFEGVDRLAIKIQRIQLHASMEPSVKSSRSAAPGLTEEQVMEQVMGVLIKGVYSALDAKLKEKKLPLKAQDVVRLTYTKADWTLRARVSSRVINAFVPAGLLGDLHLTAFSFSDKGLALRLQTAE